MRELHRAMACAQVHVCVYAGACVCVNRGAFRVRKSVGSSVAVLSGWEPSDVDAGN